MGPSWYQLSMLDAVKIYVNRLMNNTRGTVDEGGVEVPCQEREDLIAWLETEPVFETDEQRQRREDLELAKMLGMPEGVIDV